MVCASSTETHFLYGITLCNNHVSTCHLNVCWFKSVKAVLLVRLTRSQLQVIYRPPSSSNMSQFYDDLSEMFVRIGNDIDTDRLVACGDFSCSGTEPTSILAELSTLFGMHGLQQHVRTDPTRTTSTTSCLLDLVINGANSSRVSKVAVRSTYDVSDHDLVTWHIAAGTKPTRHVQTYSSRNLKKVNWQQFRSDVYCSELFSLRLKSLPMVLQIK